MEEKIRLYCRIKPKSPADYSAQQFIDVEDGQTVAISVKSTNKRDKFTFDSVLDDCKTQQQVFETVGAPLLEKFYEGYNTTIMCYGQTGSGKTYTTFGPSTSFLETECDNQFTGLVPRVLQQIWNYMETHRASNVVFTPKCSFVEIYQEKLIDLLAPTKSNMLKNTDIQCQEVPVYTMAEVFNVLSRGYSNRKMSSTESNSESSRSHAIFSLTLTRKETNVHGNAVNTVTMPKITLVDLAGSERLCETKAQGEQVREACSINKSLTTLGKVIDCLVEGNLPPFRDSKLTLLLREALIGNSMTVFVATISQSEASASTSYNTLQFAQRVKKIKTRVKVFEEVNGSAKGLQMEVKSLRASIAETKEACLNECNELREQLETKQNAIEEMSETIKNFETQISEMSVKYNELDSQNKTYIIDINQMTLQLDHLQQSLVSERSQVVDLQAQIFRKENEFEQLKLSMECENRTLQNTLKSTEENLNVEVQKSLERQQTLFQTNDLLRSEQMEIKNSKQLIDELNDLLAQRNQSIENHLQTNKDFSNQIETLSKDNSTLQSSLNDLQGQQMEWRNKESKMESKIRDIEITLNELNSANTELKTNLENSSKISESEYTQLRRQLDEARKSEDETVRQLKQTLISSEHEASARIAEMSKAMELQEARHQQEMKAMEEIHRTRMSADHIALSHSYNNLKCEYEDLKQSFEHAEKENRKYVLSTELMQRHIDDLIKEKANYCSHGNSKQKIQLHLQLKKEIKTLQEERDDALSEVRKLKAKSSMVVDEQDKRSRKRPLIDLSNVDDHTHVALSL